MQSSIKDRRAQAIGGTMDKTGKFTKVVIALTQYGPPLKVSKVVAHPKTSVTRGLCPAALSHTLRQQRKCPFRVISRDRTTLQCHPQPKFADTRTQPSQDTVSRSQIVTSPAPVMSHDSTTPVQQGSDSFQSHPPISHRTPMFSATPQFTISSHYHTQWPLIPRSRQGKARHCLA